MGCLSSKEAQKPEDGAFNGLPSNSGRSTEKYTRPKWKSDTRLKAAELKAMREEFWFSAPPYSGKQIIWDSLRAACEAENDSEMRLIIETAGIIVAAKDMTICYDELGGKYELPAYVWSDPVNLVTEEE